MNLHRLNIFCLVVEYQSFTAAAEHLLLSQAAVHLQVRALERSLGMSLLVRQGRRMLPTEAGDEVYRHARRMLADGDEMARALADLRAARAGRLTLGASSSASYLLTPLLAEFRANVPAARIQLKVDQGDQICAQVLKGDFDLAVVVPRVIPEGLNVERLCDQRLLLLAHPSHPLARRGCVEVAELAKEMHVVNPVGTAHREHMERALAQLGLYHVRISMEVGSIEALKLAVQAGDGIAFLPEHTVRLELAAGTLQVIELQDVAPIMVPLVLVTHPHRAFSPLASQVIDFVRQKFSAKMPRRSEF